MLASRGPFYRFLREERVFCAVLAHLLMQVGGNLRAFLGLLNSRLPSDRAIPTAVVDDAEVYPEFSFLRDWWFALGRNNDQKRDLIFKLAGRVPSLGRLDPDALPQQPAGFNARFMGDRGLRITRDIVYPGQWTIPALDDQARSMALGPEGFRDLCRFKWSFNIKPDLVLVVPETRPICVEAKLESKEGSYPVRADECARFDRAAGAGRRVGQLELQRFMFEYLLGEPCQPVIIGGTPPHSGTVASETNDAVFVSWSDVFRCLDLDSSIPFVRRLVDENQVPLRHRGPNRATHSPGTPLQGEVAGLEQ